MTKLPQGHTIGPAESQEKDQHAHFGHVPAVVKRAKRQFSFKLRSTTTQGRWYPSNSLQIKSFAG